MKPKRINSIILAVTMFSFLTVNSVRAEVYTQADYWPFYAGLSWTFNTSGEEWDQDVGGIREDSSFTDITEMLRLVAENLAFDSHTATLNILFGDNVSGPPDYNGTYFGIETEGIIAYGNHPLKTNNEIWDNGKIWLPLKWRLGKPISTLAVLPGTGHGMMVLNGLGVIRVPLRSSVSKKSLFLPARLWP